MVKDVPYRVLRIVGCSITVPVHDGAQFHFIYHMSDNLVTRPFGCALRSVVCLVVFNYSCVLSVPSSVVFVTYYCLISAALSCHGTSEFKRSIEKVFGVLSWLIMTVLFRTYL